MNGDSNNLNENRQNSVNGDEEIEIIDATQECIDGIMIIENLSFPVPWSRKSITDEITKNSFARYICARIGGQVVGYAGMWLICREGHITNIAVHPEFRGNGIGSRLLNRLIEIARENYILAVTLEVRKSNLIAQKLYKKYGFVPCGVRRGYYSDNGEDAIIMWKELD